MNNFQPKPLWFGQAKRWYDGSRWRNARKWFLSQPENIFCAMCLKRGVEVEAMVVDHKIAHKGSYELFWDVDNWSPLCTQCHNSIKQVEDIHGYSQACGVDGLPTSENHPFNKVR